MSGLSSPPRFYPPISPRRAVSPTMSPGRRGRATGSSEESQLRDLSPNTTLRAFTVMPIPFDTTSDEYKIFACIENLTPAEKDLGTRVAKAAQRLKNWCEEIGQWGWAGTFEQPSEEFREKRRRSVEARIREHVKDPNEVINSIGPLEYWGSLLSVEVEAHEARLDEIGEELLALDIEELKEHVLDIHGPNRSRPSTSGFEAKRLNYNLLDDFSFLITQTLLSALPHHFQLKDRLSTWTARVSILREAPRYLDDLKTSQRAMGLGWDAIEPPLDLSDASFDKWKEAIDTISGVLQEKVGDLGRRLDRMLDTLEGREDCLPDNWIDTFEGLEADFGRWNVDSRRRIIEVDVRRMKALRKVEGNESSDSSERLDAHSDPSSATELRREELPGNSLSATLDAPAPTVPAESNLTAENVEPRLVTAFKTEIPNLSFEQPGPVVDEGALTVASETDLAPVDDSVFEEDDTVLHNELEHPEDSSSSTSDLVHVRERSNSFSESPVVVTTKERPDMDEFLNRPQTPRSRSGSVDSISSSISFNSSPPSMIEDSPSVRNATNRQAKTARPELNVAMAKRRPLKNVKDLSVDNAPPWPPTSFAKQLSPNSTDDLDRKISDILTTIPAHIRLKSGPGADAPEVKPRRAVAGKSSKGYLRAARSISGMKSPELTLSPAKQDFDTAGQASGRRSAAAMRGDNDIKLYHLTQPGKEHPIKLFIRRVGENGERVMVRVGGGWADLGEYLRQYAEHHGRRTVSEGKFEILGLEIKNSDPPPRPESAMSKRDRRFSGGGPGESPNTTPKKPGGVGILKGEAQNEERGSNVPSMTTTPTAGATETSAPSTGSSRHSWTGNEVGLAGPKAKKLDLSGEKLEWIEGMLKQARTVSGNVQRSGKDDQAPHNRDDKTETRSESRTGGRGKQPDFGDLGKVGGTKRVFMRGSGLGEH
ncbi:hypothetical protein K469DRAFT_721573 [Zopfia rhizophila CBS 207.26]|uniref:GAR domain-containing protein n=1 Tax=Zopfia rhizophila CBS 207.26 TaxID=1314779 RepID=A0A6A6EG31_9PEZI|nr:hypothetical protein K469DRAFT_721573 [Zopfia rhizophila CBS 207.26]